MMRHNARPFCRSIGLIGILAATSAGCTSSPSLPDPLAAGWKGEPVCESLHEDTRQRVLRCTFEPGVGHERHYHDAHFGYTIVGGRMRITDGEGVREIDIVSGSSFVSPGEDSHEALNVGETTAVFLIVEPK
jgi:quercetin dioxygenase-like cupin family protein